MKQKVLILCSNYEASQFPSAPDAEDRFFTYGFGGNFGRLFSAYLKEYDFEVWRMDSFVNEKYYGKAINGINYKVFRSHSIKKLGLFSGTFIKALRAEVKENNPILFVVHTHNFQTYQIAFFLRRAMIVTTHHGDWSPFFVYKNSRGLKKLRALLGMATEKLVLKNINYFLLCDLKQVQYVHRAAPDAKWILFSTGLDISKFNIIAKDEARDQLGLERKRKYILYVGKLYIYKQIEELLNIWKEIQHERPEVDLLLVGNEARGSWGEEYYDMAESYGAKIIGRVKNTELYKYYCASDVYVLVGLREDNFGGTGIAPLESLACNTPVVSNSMLNYLGDETDGICEIPKDLDGYKKAILKVLDHPENYSGMRESVEKYYAYSETARRTNEIFKNLLNQRKNNA